MSEDYTTRWALPLLHAGQAHKEMFHNEALVRIDMLLHGTVESAALTVPPGTPASGQCWIVGAGGSGAWEGQDGAVAGWTGGGWRFVAARAGLTVMVRDRGHAMRHDGSLWRDEALRADGLHIGGQRVVGAQGPSIAAPTGGTVVDDAARTTLGAILTALRGHGLIAP